MKSDFYGYAGKVLYVDLSRGKVVVEALDSGYAEALIGGFGVNNMIAYEHAPPMVDPFAPESVVVFGAGPLNGTIAPGAGKVHVTAKMPLTGFYGTSGGGGGFAAQLKFAGYDHLVVAGRAKRPVVLVVEDEEVSFEDAKDLWGGLIYNVTAELWERYSGSSVIAIGPAGENLVKFSIALVDNVASLGRGGLGAVLGSKNLKAIVVKGSGGVKIADAERFFNAVEALHRRIKEYPFRSLVAEYGMMAGWLAWAEMFQVSREEAEAYFNQEVFSGKVKVASIACPSCPLSDKFLFRMPEENVYVWATDYLTPLMVFGYLFQIKDYRKVLKLTAAVNQYGIDMLSLSSIVRFLLAAYGEGLVTREDLGGLVPKADAETVLAVVNLMVQRKGIGSLLAEGWRAVLKKFGDFAERHVALVKGLDVLYDPRRTYFGSLEFEQLVCPRGPTSNSGGSPTYVPGKSIEDFRKHCDRICVSSEAIERILEGGELNIGRLVRHFEDWYSVLSSLGICNRAYVNRFYSMKICAELYSSATGIEKTPQELKLAGERAWNVQKMLNVREGHTKHHDLPPRQWFQPLVERGRRYVVTDYFRRRELTENDLEKALRDYYEERGWNPETGTPTEEKLRQLGLMENRRSR
ncbi:MAG: aldehyde ferredoxin oxidoreductase N-terminal domain-containing protein [Candidatus Jordarchaeales archaeon]